MFLVVIQLTAAGNNTENALLLLIDGCFRFPTNDAE